MEDLRRKVGHEDHSLASRGLCLEPACVGIFPMQQRGTELVATDIGHSVMAILQVLAMGLSSLSDPEQAVTHLLDLYNCGKSHRRWCECHTDFTD